jgi:sulfatase maturation enzyme AslB (radical SAM superfamily)
MIHKLLNKLGFIKHLTDDELLNEYVRRMRPDTVTDKEFKAKEEEIFDNMREIDGISEYYRETVARDLKRHYASSTPMEQFQIRGATARTLYFKGLLSEKKAPKEFKTNRHA